MAVETAQREPASGVGARVLIGSVLLLALALRFLRLGTWGFDSDEIFMLNDSLHPRRTNPRPLLYLLNHYLIEPLRPLNEFGIRLLPAVFGALAVPAVYWVGHRLINRRAALCAAFLLAISGQHVNYSQFGRYWSLVFLLTAVYPYAIYLGVRERRRGWIVAGVVLGVLATLAHPVSILLVGGPLLVLAWTYLRPQRFVLLWQRPAVRWATLAAVVVVALALIRFLPVLQGWIAIHDAGKANSQFLVRQKFAVGLQQAAYLLAFVEGWSLPVVLTAVAGIYLLSQRDRSLALFLSSLALFPIAFLTLISIRTPVSTYYLIPTTPVFFLGAGYFMDRIWASDWAVRPRWLVPATVTVLVIFPGLPTLVSQYLNGRRYDFKTVAQWLGPQLTPHDVIFSDQPVALAYYLPDARVERLRYDTAPLTQSLAAARGGSGGALWVVAPAPAHAFRTNLKQGGLADWIFGHCQLRTSVGRGRVDFRQQYLHVYRCPPAEGLGPGERHLSGRGTDSTSAD